MIDKDFERYKQLKNMSDGELKEYIEYVELKKKYYNDKAKFIAISSVTITIFVFIVFFLVLYYSGAFR